MATKKGSKVGGKGSLGGVVGGGRKGKGTKKKGDIHGGPKTNGPIVGPAKRAKKKR
jgi:hypothetical protein